MKIVKLLVYSNAVVSLSVGVLTFACAQLIGNKNPMIMGWAAFFSTLFIYNMQRILRLKGIGEDSSERLIWIKKNALQLTFFSILSILACLFLYFFFLGIEWDILFLALSAFFGVLYAFEFSPKIEGLRDIPYIKIYLIAILWAMVVVFWPYLRSLPTHFPQFLLLSVFFYILACTVPFDIRDMYYDNKEKRTIPQIFGETGAKTVALIFALISCYILFLGYPDLFANVWFYISYGGLVLLILFSRSTLPELYFSGIIDCWIISYGICLLFL